jgi:hypothetical protein
MEAIQPTIAETVTTARLSLLMPLAGRHVALLVLLHVAVSHPDWATRTELVRSAVPKFKPTTVILPYPLVG